MSASQSDPLPASEIEAAQTNGTDPQSEATQGETSPAFASYGTSYDNEHPQGDDIRRQVEFYFSDGNLVHDIHLLAKTGGDGNGPVTIRHICGFGKMRKYKPYTSVVGSLKRSTVLEILENKYVRRRVPLTKPLLVQPKLAPDIEHIHKALEGKPWLTKNMVKATGFETNFADVPITPEAFAEQQKLYDPDLSFTTRVETAVQRYTAKRKMHETTLKIFAKWMNFGGIYCGQRQFSGGMDDKFLEDRDATEIAALTSTYHVMTDVEDEDKYIVDFEGVAKGFLSSHFPTTCDWSTEEQVKSATNILRNFYNYLLYHDVCPEYADQLLAARKICDLTDQELPPLSEASRQLPGDLNTACSTLHKGNFASLYAGKNDWNAAEAGLSDENAKVILMAGIAAYGTEEQYEQAAAMITTGFKVISEETLGLEVVGTQLADEVTKEYYEQGKLKGTYLRTLGKLHCKRWTPPNAPEEDLPKAVLKQRKAQDFTFWVEEEILRHCVHGMKMEATIKELDIGVKWIDSVLATYCTFFTYLPNEHIRSWKEPGPAKPWMRRQPGSEGAETDGIMVAVNNDDHVV